MRREKLRRKSNNRVENNLALVEGDVYVDRYQVDEGRDGKIDKDRPSAGQKMSMDEWFELHDERTVGRIRKYAREQNLPNTRFVYQELRDAVNMAILESYYDYDPDKSSPRTYVERQSYSYMSAWRNTEYLFRSSAFRANKMLGRRIRVAMGRAKDAERDGECGAAKDAGRIAAGMKNFSNPNIKFKPNGVKKTFVTPAAVNALLAGCVSSDELIYDDGDPETVGSRIPDDMPTVEDEVEKKLMIGFVMDYMKRRYTDFEIRFLLDWVDDPRTVFLKWFGAEARATATTRRCRKRNLQILNQLKERFV